MRIREQTLWTLQLRTGGILLGLLGLHMAIMHLDAALGLTAFNPAGEHPIDWANVAHRARSAFFTVTYVLLLAAALFHGLNGLRNIVAELALKPGIRRSVDILLVVAGGALLVLGTWAAFAAGAAATT